MPALVRTFCCLLIIAALNAQSIDLKQVFPLGVQPAATTLLTFTGNLVESATDLWTSFPATNRRIGSQKPGEVQFEVTCTEKILPELAVVQLVGPKGISQWHLVLVDPLPLSSSFRSRGKTAPPLLQQPCAIDAALTLESADHYQLALKQGESISLEIVAHSLGSNADPVLAVFNEEGEEEFYCDDYQGGRDSKIGWTAPRDATYTIQVRDVGFAGGQGFFYRLRIGTFPLVNNAFSTLIRSWENHRPSAAGGILSSQLQREALLAEGFFPDRRVYIEQVEGHDLSQSQWPISIYGSFEANSGKDRYSFQARADETLVFAAFARSFGSPCDVMLRIQDANGQTIASANPSHPGEMALTNKFSKSGNYFLHVEELSGATGPHLLYRVDISHFQPGFELSTADAFVELKPGERGKLKISCTRFSFDGPIELTLVAAGEGIQLKNSVLPEKKTEIELELLTSPDWLPGQAIRFHIVGQNASGYGAVVKTTPALRKIWPLKLYPPEKLEGLLTVGFKEN